MAKALLGELDDVEVDGVTVSMVLIYAHRRQLGASLADLRLMLTSTTHLLTSAKGTITNTAGDDAD